MTVYDYPVDRVHKVVDGDTLDVDFHVEVGFHVRTHGRVRLRLVIIDTPERGQSGYGAATLFLSDWLRERAAYLRFASHRQDRDYGRWLADVYDRRNGDSASAALLAAGLATVWA